VIASKNDYSKLVNLLQDQNGQITLEQRKSFAAKAFKVVADYDIAINNYFNPQKPLMVLNERKETILRYGRKSTSARSIPW
jgi:phosphoribosylaminoimidazolecarboxamide formyltransferase/IMP cyclohydrolase